MARYKPIDTSPRFIAVDLERQLLPGTFEHALNHLIDHELDLSGFDARYRNDLNGAPAYPHGARTARPQRCEHDDDLHPCAQQGRARGDESVGSVVTAKVGVTKGSPFSGTG